MGTFPDDTVFQSSIPKAADITIAVVYTVFGICSVVGNSTLLYVSYKKKRFLKPAEFFIINLAVSDLGLTVSLYPLAILSSFYHRWLFGPVVCTLYAFCGVLFGICSLTTLTLLSLVCFMKVCYPQYGNRFSAAHSRLLLVGSWLYALFFAGAPLARWGRYGPEPYGTACCIDWLSANQAGGSRSYTLVLFTCCYLLPCVLILSSYTGVLVSLHNSSRTMKQHHPAPARLSNVHTIIIKLSVAVCIGFFSAWSPYAVVSMWASFGQISSLPPLAFAMPAMFAKSSTIYNPVIYLLLRPHSRRLLLRDLGLLRRACLGCSGPRRPDRVQTVSLGSGEGEEPHLVHRQLKGSKCSDAFQCFQHFPKITESENPTTGPGPKNQQVSTKKTTSIKTRMWSKRRAEIEHFRISLDTMPGRAKVAWH